MVLLQRVIRLGYTRARCIAFVAGWNFCRQRGMSTHSTKRQKHEDANLVIDLTKDDDIVIEEDVNLVDTGDRASVDAWTDFPMTLLKLKRGIPAWANAGPLGFSMKRAVAGDIRWAFVSNYMIDMPWMASAYPDLLFSDHIVIVHGNPAQTQEITGSLGLYGLEKDQFYVHAPPVPPYGTHHSKAFMLQYATGLRMIIHTANMVYPDVNNKSQAVFMQDFPRKDEKSPPSSDFEDTLVSYVHSLGLSAEEYTKAAKIIKSHDFSMARAALIPSIPSKPWEFGEEQAKNYGHLRLRDCLENEMFEERFIGTPIVAQFSSIGNISQKFLDGFTDSASAGRVAGRTAQLGRPKGTYSIEEKNESNNNSSKCVEKTLELVWPSVDEVRNSLEGWFAGGSIPGYPDRVRKPLLMDMYRTWGGEMTGRQRAMPHMKTYVRYHAEHQEIAWACIGSHNFSKAAWGEQVQSKKYNKKLFRILSFELSALLLPSLELAYRKSRFYGFSCTDPAPSYTEMNTDDVAAVRFVPWKHGQDERVTISRCAEGQKGKIIKVPIPLPYQVAPRPYPQSKQQPLAPDPASDPSTYASCPWDTRTNAETVWQGVDALGLPFPGHGSYYGHIEEHETCSE